MEPSRARPVRQPEPFYHHRDSLITIYLASLFQGALGIILPASSTLLRQRLSLGDTLYGSLFLPYLGLAVLTALFGHVLLRRFSLKMLFLFALSSQSLCMILMGVSGSTDRALGLPLLFAATALAGPAAGLIGITLNTAAIELFPRARGGALSALHGILGLGATLGPMLVASGISRGIWIAAPLTMAAAQLSLFLAARSRPLVGLGDTLVDSHGRGDAPLRLWLCCIPAFLYCICEAVFTVWAVVFLKEIRGLPVEVAAGALSAFWVAMTVGRLGGALAVRRLPSKPLVVLLGISVAAAFLLVARARGPVDSTLRFAFAGLSCSALFPLLLGQVSAEFPDRVPQVTALFSAWGMIGLAVGSFGVGPLLALIPLPRIYLLAAVCPLALVAAALLLSRPGSGAGHLRTMTVPLRLSPFRSSRRK